MMWDTVRLSAVVIAVVTLALASVGRAELKTVSTSGAWTNTSRWSGSLVPAWTAILLR